MKNVTLKPNSLRTAKATATLKMPADCATRLRENNVDKGNALEIARVAGIMAAKNTDDIIPLCHPLPLQQAEVRFDIGDEQVRIETEVQTIGPTGVEMEALTAASVAALTLYDLLKPHTEQMNMSLTNVHLLQKKGGKSHFRRQLKVPATAAVIVLSDTVAAGKKPDTAGASVRDSLEHAGFDIAAYEVLPDEPDQLRARAQHWIAEQIDFIVTVGGTGVGPRDCSVETIEPLLTTPMPGLMETARNFGQQRTPFAMMSRGVAGLAGKSIVATFPGSRKGAEETLAALLPGLVHLVEVCRDQQHPGGYQ